MTPENVVSVSSPPTFSEPFVRFTRPPVVPPPDRDPIESVPPFSTSSVAPATSARLTAVSAAEVVPARADRVPAEIVIEPAVTVVFRSQILLPPALVSVWPSRSREFAA
jgi:hypothetical protein